MTRNPDEVTRLLQEWSDGDPEALDRLLPMVIEQVRRLAQRALAGEGAGNTLQPTELVNEVYLRLVGRQTYWWRDRRQFFSTLSQLMRRILVDRARRRLAAKRGAGVVPVPLDEGIFAANLPDPEILKLDDALEELKELDPRKYRGVMLWYFVGLKQEEIATELDVAINTVRRDLKAAQHWLRKQIRADSQDES